MTINKKELFYIFSCFIWIAPFYLPNRYEVIIRCALIAFVFLTQKIKWNPLLILTLIFIGSISFSTVLFDYGSTNLVNTLSIMSVLLGAVVCSSNPADVKNMPNGLLKGIMIYFIIDAFFIFVTNGIGMNDNKQPVYFSGGKFDVCYMYLFLIVLIFLRYKWLEIKHQFLGILFGAVLCLKVDCSTGLLGILSFYGIMLLPKVLKKGKSKYIWLLGTLWTHYLIVFAQVQSNNPFLRYVITNILHKEIHLTGRTVIYDNFDKIMEGHWLLGHGYTSDHILEITKLANTQNGFLQIVYIGGIVALIIFMLMLIYLIHYINKIENEKEQNILFSALMAFFVIAIVEIPFNSVIFFILIGVMYTYSCRKKGVRNG